MDPFRETIEQVKAGFLQAKQRMVQIVDTFPEDRMNWSPSPSARTPVQQVAHAANSIKYLLETFKGNTFPAKTAAEADQIHLANETQYSTREQVLQLLEQNGNEYLAWLDLLTPEQFVSDVKMPFNLGSMPLKDTLGFCALHTNHHTAQLEYMQTIYGDRDWH